MESSVKLIIQFEGKEWEVELRDGGTILGRSSRCTVPLKDTALSRQHCEIKKIELGWTLIDLDSKNGTFLNGEKVRQKELHEGDRIFIGTTTLFFGKKTETADKKDPQPVIKPKKLRETKTVVTALTILLLIAVLGGSVYLILSSKRSTTFFDANNLLVENPSFEKVNTQGIPIGWSWYKPVRASAFSTDTKTFRSGKCSLVVKKAKDDAVIECLCEEYLSVHTGEPLEVNVWARADKTPLSVFLRMLWYGENRDQPFLEESSQAFIASTNWEILRESFAPPPQAKSGRLILSILGNDGLVYFDDVRIYANPRGVPSQRYNLQDAQFSISKNGIFSMFHGFNKILNNIQIGFVHQDQTLFQSISEPVQFSSTGTSFLLKGALYHPATLKPISYEQEIVYQNGKWHLFYRFKRDSLKQLHALQIKGDFPRAKQFRSYPPAQEATSRLLFEQDDIPRQITFFVPMMFSATPMRDAMEWSATYNVLSSSQASENSLVIGIALSELTLPRTATVNELFQAAEKNFTEGHYSEAYAMYKKLRSLLAQTPERLPEIENKMHALRDLAEQRRNEVDLKIAATQLLRQPEAARAALEAIADYTERFSDAEFLPAYLDEAYVALFKWRDGVQKSRNLPRAAATFQTGQEYFKKGKFRLSAIFCEEAMLLAPGTSLAQEAQNFLFKMQGKEALPVKPPADKDAEFASPALMIRLPELTSSKQVANPTELSLPPPTLESIALLPLKPWPLAPQKGKFYYPLFAPPLIKSEDLLNTAQWNELVALQEPTQKPRVDRRNEKVRERAVLYLKDKEKKPLEGEIVYGVEQFRIAEDIVKIRTEWGEVNVKKQDIDRIEWNWTFGEKYAYEQQRSVVKDVSTYYKLYEQCLSLGMVLEAKEALKNVLRLDPNFARAYDALLALYREEVDFENQLQLMTDALANPKFDKVDWFYRLGQLYLDLGLKEKALEVLHQTIEEYPGFEKARVCIGQILLQQGRAREASDQFRRTLEYDDRSAEAHLGRGLYELLKGNWSAAQQSLERALQLNNLLPEAHRDLGVVFFAQQNIAKAAQEFYTAIRVSQYDTESWINLGILYLLAGESDKAVELFNKASQRDPSSADAVNGQALIFLSKGQKEKAGQAFQKALQMESQNAFALYAQGVLYLEDQKGAEAETALVQALQRDSSFQPLYYATALALLQNKKVREAEVLVRRLLEGEPTHLRAQLLLANVALAQKQYAEAKQIFLETQKVSPSDPQIWNGLAYLAYYDGNSTEPKRLLDAKEALKNALKLDPENEYAKRALAIIQQKEKK